MKKFAKLWILTVVTGFIIVIDCFSVAEFIRLDQIFIATWCYFVACGWFCLLFIFLENELKIERTQK